MIKAFITRLRQGYKTIGFPRTAAAPPERFRGLPNVNNHACAGGDCAACIAVCPTKAVSLDKGLCIDLGACIFCGACAKACPQGAIRFTPNHVLSARARHDLLCGENSMPAVKALSKDMLRIFGRSLKLRQVSAGGCNACEADINVLGTIVYDLGRFGVQIVASPRHADGLLITGPVTKNMQVALLKTYEAVPDPKIVVAVGACAINGGPFVNCTQHLHGVTEILPVDLFIPGCPPHPLTILDGILRLLGKIK
ncbi:MAG: NADH-quinone oxidoreductase subunit NuoB [Chitinivibrionales bacterium]|nr:NADH-quinone oxidoreductase subunit NuoB [Chitinivibrionales bacterium]